MSELCHPDDHLVAALTGADAGEITEAARLFRALADPGRLSLLAALARGERCVTELAVAQGDKLSTVSQRLRLLMADHLVSRRRDGKHVYYGLADEHVVELIANGLAHAREVRGG